MDFVISNVTTVEEEEEPLLEITKIIMLKEKKEYPTKVRKEYSPKVTKEYNTNVRIPKYRKICYVPLCPNTSVSTPDKMFITVPVNPVRRKLWLDAVGKTNGKNPKSPMFCCQDHFNLEKDMKNYEEHLRKGRVQMLLYQTAVPHKFLCNKYGHLKRGERLEVLRELHEVKNVKRNYDDLDDDEAYDPSKVSDVSKLTSRQRSLRAAKMCKTETSTPNKSVFIEMPQFEYDDQPHYVEIEEGEEQIDTIVIDDSDSDVC